MVISGVKISIFLIIFKNVKEKLKTDKSKTILEKSENLLG